MTKITSPSPPASAVVGKRLRRFADDYRLQIIALIKQEKRGVSSIAKELGLSTSLIHNWLKRYEEGMLSDKGKDISLLPSQATVVSGDYAAELAALRKENAILRDDCDIHHIFLEHDGRYGLPRIYNQLKTEGRGCSRGRQKTAIYRVLSKQCALHATP